MLVCRYRRLIESVRKDCEWKDGSVVFVLVVLCLVLIALGILYCFHVVNGTRGGGGRSREAGATFIPAARADPGRFRVSALSCRPRRSRQFRVSAPSCRPRRSRQVIGCFGRVLFAVRTPPNRRVRNPCRPRRSRQVRVSAPSCRPRRSRQVIGCFGRVGSGWFVAANFSILADKKWYCIFLGTVSPAPLVGGRSSSSSHRNACGAAESIDSQSVSPVQSSTVQYSPVQAYD
jgi:hypothetical protein